VGTEPSGTPRNLQRTKSPRSATANTQGNEVFEDLIKKAAAHQEEIKSTIQQVDQE